MSRYKPVVTLVALLTLLAVAAPGVETAADLSAPAQVQPGHLQLQLQGHHVERGHVELGAASLQAVLDGAVAVVHNACAEVASLLDSWPALVSSAIVVFEDWIRSFGWITSCRPPDLT